MGRGHPAVSSNCLSAKLGGNVSRHYQNFEIRSFAAGNGFHQIAARSPVIGESNPFRQNTYVNVKRFDGGSRLHHGGGIRAMYTGKVPPTKLSHSPDRARTDPLANRQQPRALRPIQRLLGHEGVICALAWSPDGSTLASASRDCTIRLWNVDKWVLQRKLAVHASWIKCIDWSPDSRLIASGSVDQRVILWNTRESPTEAYQHGDHVECVAWSPSGAILASGARDGTLILWDVANRKIINRLVTHGKAITSLVWSSDGQLLAAAARDSMIHIWPAQEFKTRLDLPMDRAVSSLSWSTHSDRLAVGCDDNDVRIVSPTGDTRNALLLEGHLDTVVFTRFSRDGQLLLTGSRDGTCLVWDCNTWKALASLKTSKTKSHHGGVACHPRSLLAACLGDRSQTVNVFDLSEVIAKPRRDSMPANAQRTILFLAANPKGTNPLRLDQELKKIEQGLERAKKRDQFNLVQKWAVTDDDLRRALLEHAPEIVHFSGHGSGAAGLVFEDDQGSAQSISADALAGLFELFADHLRCVILNACYSEAQASEIVRHIDFVVGMKDDIGDESAIKFAVGFYDAVGAGRPYDNAFKFGCNAINLKGLNEHGVPILHTKP
jgi:WD40 repeat protein